MFDSGMREASEALVDIDDVPLEVFTTLLQHLYTDTVRVPSGLALPLFAVSDRFGVLRLKEICAACVQAELGVDNVCAALTIADTHSDAELLRTCVTFIVDNFVEVHATCGFKRLPVSLLHDVVHPAISVLMVRGGSPRCSAKTVATPSPVLSESEPDALSPAANRNVGQITAAINGL